MSRCVRGSGLGWCVYPTRGDSARAGRALWRHKNGEYAAVTHGRPAFQQHEAHAEGNDTTPTRKRQKCKTGVLSPPPTRSRRNPAKRFRREEDERQSERVLPLAAGRGIRRPLGRRPASHLSGLRRSRCPAKRTGRGKALHPNSGRKPGPTFSYDWRKT